MITLLFKDCAQLLHCKCFLSETVLFASVQPLQCLQTTKYLRSRAAEGHCSRSSVVWRLPHGVTEDADTKLHISCFKQERHVLRCALNRSTYKAFFNQCTERLDNYQFILFTTIIPTPTFNLKRNFTCYYNYIV